jgi:hypothetical protein
MSHLAFALSGVRLEILTSHMQSSQLARYKIYICSAVRFVQIAVSRASSDRFAITSRRLKNILKAEFYVRVYFQKVVF